MRILFIYLTLKRSGALAGWGLCAGVAVFFLAERIPMFRSDVMCKIPILGRRYEDYRHIEEEED